MAIKQRHQLIPIEVVMRVVVGVEQLADEGADDAIPFPFRTDEIAAFGVGVEERMVSGFRHDQREGRFAIRGRLGRIGVSRWRRLLE